MIEKREEGCNYWEKVTGVVSDTCLTVKGLVDGKKYTFRVKTENLRGVSEPRESSVFTAKNPFGLYK